jgi:hypothetical protein
MKKIFNIKISEDGLNSIMKALECYSRLGLNQFAYCLEHNPKFDRLDWDDKREIEEYLRHKIDARNFGIYHPEVAKFNQAFQIKKEIEKHISIAREPIMQHITNNYDGALEEEAYLPFFFDDSGNKIEHKISIKIDKKHHSKLKKLKESKKYEELWQYVDKNIKNNDIKGLSSEISSDFNELIIYKPYKLIKTEEPKNA